jgi:hypothetical protein
MRLIFMAFPPVLEVIPCNSDSLLTSRSPTDFLVENALKNDAAREDFREQHPFTWVCFAALVRRSS